MQAANEADVGFLGFVICSSSEGFVTRWECWGEGGRAPACMSQPFTITVSL